MLNWDFGYKAGKATYLDNEGKQRVYNLYEGNAYLIEVAEWRENGRNLYSVRKFALDKKHLETQIAEGDYAKLIRLTINKDVCRKAYEIAKLFGKLDGVTVEIK